MIWCLDRAMVRSIGLFYGVVMKGLPRSFVLPWDQLPRYLPLLRPRDSAASQKVDCVLFCRKKNIFLPKFLFGGPSKKSAL